jgi:hypothetical protein
MFISSQVRRHPFRYSGSHEVPDRRIVEYEAAIKLPLYLRALDNLRQLA